MQESWRLSKYKVKKILHCFCVDISASKTALLLGYSRKTIDRCFNIFREHILAYQHQALQAFAGAIELDASYFGARRVRAKRGRGAAGKIPVFAVLKGKEQILLTVVKNCSKKELLPIITGQVLENATVYSDGWKVYAQEIPADRLIQGKNGTVALEKNNGRQRHWFARFRKKSIVVSKALRMVELTVALFARFHVNGSREDIKSFFC